MHRNTPVRSTSIVRCHSASVCSVNGFGVRRDAGVVARAVEAAEPVDRGLHHRARPRPSSTTSARDRDRVAVDGTRRCRSRSLRRRRRPRRSRRAAANTSAIACADAASGAGDQRDLPAKGHACAPRDTGRCGRRGRSPRSDRTWRARAPRRPSCPSAPGIRRGGPSSRPRLRSSPRLGARPRSPRCPFLATRSRTTSSCGRARPCSARRSTSAPAAAPGPGSTIALVMLTTQPEPRSRIAGTTALVRRYGVITFTSYATRSRRSDVSSIER